MVSLPYSEIIKYLLSYRILISITVLSLLECNREVIGLLMSYFLNSTVFIGHCTADNYRGVFFLLEPLIYLYFCYNEVNAKDKGLSNGNPIDFYS